MKEEDLTMYETIIILSDDMTEAEVTKKKEALLHSIVHSDDPEEDHIPAYVHKIDYIGKKKLAYEIKGHKEGYYLIYAYHTKPERIPQLERILRKDDDVIKFMSMKIDSNTAKENNIDITTTIEPKEMQDETPREIDAFDLIFG